MQEEGAVARSYFSVAAAEGNLGDVFIRRELARIVAQSRTDATVYTGAMSDSYIRDLELPREWRITQSRLFFICSLVVSIVTGSARVFMAPGPAVLNGSATGTLKHFGVLAMFWLVKLSRGQIFVVGRSVRGHNEVRIRIEREMVRAADFYGARDDATIDILGERVSRIPDLAFTFAQADRRTVARTYLGISLRHDRPIDLTAVSAVLDFARKAGLSPLFVTQVREDGIHHEELGQLLNVEHVDWPESHDHTRQEARVNAAYASCVTVISDRLHALLFAARQTALPVIVDRVGEDKLQTTLNRYLDLPTVVLERSVGLPTWDVLNRKSENLEIDMADAHRELETVRSLILGRLRS